MNIFGVKFKHEFLFVKHLSLFPTDKDGRDAILLMLIKSGAKLNVTDKDGYTPLHNCVMQSVLGNFSLSTMKILVQAGSSFCMEKRSSADQSR